MPERTLGREQVLRYRFRRHQLDREPGSASGATDVDLLDLGVQDTGPDGSAWALVVRGAPIGSLSEAGDEIALAWTLRGAPHAYRRADLEAVAVATAPWSGADAAKRIFDAAKPLKVAGRDVLEALREVADAERELATKPIVKGDLSGALSAELGDEFLRFCRPCDTIHIHEQSFRLSALQAGLELEPGTSPPVLRRAPKLRPNRYQHLADEADPRFEVVRGTLRFFGPATAKEVTTFLDAAHTDVKAHWPDDVVEVSVEGVSGPRFVLADELGAVDAAADAPAARDVVVRLVGPYDGFLQGRDREVLVPDTSRHKALWPVIGRPGAVVADGEVVALWRPKTTAKGLTVRLVPWARLTKLRRAAIEVEAERLAAFRGLDLVAVADEP
ncbi:MAG TPA: crosslink repair DNA glycosylase YcaQ family protein [Acidimicrobiales bacterium]